MLFVPLYVIQFRKGESLIQTISVIEEGNARNVAIVPKHLRSITTEEVIVKVLYAGICGTDMKLYKGQYPIEKQLFPLTLGHEFVGEIVEKGNKVIDFDVGDYIVGKPTVESCMKCQYCREGKVNLCQQRLRMGINTDGAFAEYTILKSHQLINVNFLKEISTGAWLEPISVVARGINQLTLNPNYRICILGPGPIGILSALLTKEFGAHITMVGQESDRERLIYLKDNNLVDSIEIDTHMENLFDCVIDCTGNENAINNALRWIKPASQFLLLGTNKSKMNIHFSLIVYKELKVTGTIGANELDWDYALDVLQRNEAILSKLAQLIPVANFRDGFTVNNNVKAKTIIQF